jgi:hypothetical protein
VARPLALGDMQNGGANHAGETVSLPLQQGSPCGFEPRRDREYTILVHVLFTPSLQRFKSFVIQRDVASVTGLR